MRKFWRFLLLAVTGLALMVLSPPVIGQAREVTEATGLDVNSAVIKDASGKVYSNSEVLPPGDYQVNYSWQIPDSARIRSGDTMTFQLPSNIYIPEPDDFTLYAASGSGSIGTAHIDQGASYGVITLNSNMQYRTNRHGWIKVGVESKVKGSVSITKSASWSNPETPTVINWRVVAQPNDGTTMKNPVIKDTFSSNQKYIAGSAEATDAAGQTIPVAVTTSYFGNSVTFKLTGTYTGNVVLSYQTQTKLPTGADTFTNNATYSDDGGYTDSATASIDREAAPENPAPEVPNEVEPIVMDKSVSWVDPSDQTKLNWSIKVNANGNVLVNPQIIDHLSDNQTYVPASAKLVNAYGESIMLAVSTSGNSIIFHAVGSFSTSLHLTYQTTPTSSRGLETFTNSANYTDDNDNSADANATIDRTVEPTPEPIKMTKSVAWTDPEDQSRLNWTLAVAANGNKLVNPTIVDKMSGNQTYIAGSAKAVTATGVSVPVTAESNGTELTFNLSGTYTDDLKLTYRTRSDEIGTAATFTNVAVYDDEANNHASADATIDREARPPRDPISMSKTAAWVDPNDKTLIKWQLEVDANENELVNPVITDELSSNHTYVDGSAEVRDVTGPLPFTVTVEGSRLIFKIMGEYESDLEIKYQTRTTTPSGAATFDNAAVYDDENNNHAEADQSIDREAPPVEPAKDPISMAKTVAWVDPADKTKLNWQLQVTTNGNQLLNPVITDDLSSNQTFVADSAKASDATGQAIPVKTTVAGNKVTFNFSGVLTSDLTLSYQTTTNTAMGAETFDNAAVLDDENNNHAEAGTSIDREAPPEEPEPINDPIKLTKTAAWSDPNDQTKINWQLQVTTNNNQLVNPVVTDTLSGDQSYVADSAKAVTTDGTVMPVTVNVAGKTLTFKFDGKFSSDFTLTYQTTTDAATGAAVYDNVAVLDDENNNHGEANSSIDRENPPVEPVKDPIKVTKTAAWSDPTDQTKINWQLQVSANGNQLVNPVITDILSDNQTYVTDSVKAVTADGTTVPVVATVTGNTLTFKLTGQWTSDLTLTYQSTTNSATGAATFANAAVYDDENGNHGDAGSSIDRENPPVGPIEDPVTMTKVAAWTDSKDQTLINWTLAIRANGNQLVNPVITDELSDNQSYVADSAEAVDDNGQQIPLTVSVVGHTITFKLTGTFATAIKLTYRTKTNTATGADVFTNAALYTDDNGNNASASSSIDRKDVVVVTPQPHPEPVTPETPGPTEPTKPGPAKPEMQQPGTQQPAKPGQSAPTTPAPAKPNTKPSVMPSQPAPTAPTKVPSPYNPTPGRLPQTGEHRNTTLDTILGTLALLAGLALGYFDLRRRF
ncbi:Ig-like domain-containing protein [Lactiplantibacillus nangangensis]|uniref:Ig-like domain-containing protein n=1 Tax=Lactiplantibacillus nangangensis TaxID=2559917 RepID=A0ABW1SMZ3_9LACO|nr:Ig-like domain-containing protein [Lactiplantibacillus nangangensis]